MHKNFIELNIGWIELTIIWPDIFYSNFQVWQRLITFLICQYIVNVDELSAKTG